ncbi:MAG: ABC transporter permease [Pseudomonadota bacterium]
MSVITPPMGEGAAPPTPKADRRHVARRLMLAPALLVLTVGLVCPLGIVVIYSFLEAGTYGGVEWRFSLEAYQQFLFQRDIFDNTLTFSTAYLEIFGRSFLMAVLATAICLAVGFPTAYFIATRPADQRMFWVFLVTVPYWVNLLIRTLALLFLLRDQGPINAALLGVGAIETPLRIAYTDFAITLGLAYSYLPFMILPIYAALERSDIRLVEAAYDLYASKARVLVDVVIPGAKAGIIAGSLLVFIPSIGSYLAPDILGGGRELLAGNLIAQQFQASRNGPFGAACAVILMSVVMIGLIQFVRSQERTRREALR